MESRTVLFMYPDLGKVDSVEQSSIVRIISDLKLVISEANRQIGKILQNEDNFSYIRCLPTIGMVEANKRPNEENIDFVRVCVISCDKNNYESTYSDICNQYANNNLKISHLIGLKINSDSEKTQFSRPDGSAFDVIVESNFDNIVGILTSIMLDTSLYHYFGLSNEVEYRKQFSLIKMEAIRANSLLDGYGNIDNLEKIIYLPFSYPYIKRYFEPHENRSEKELIINNLITDYFVFIKETVCKHLEFNNDKEISKPYANINNRIKDAITMAIMEPFFEVDSSYIVAIDNAIPKGKIVEVGVDCFVVKDDGNNIKNWLLNVTKPLSGYTLLYIKIGD